MNKKQKIIIIGIISVLFVFIAGGIAQIIDPSINGTIKYDNWGYKIVDNNFSLNPIVILRGLFSKYGILIFFSISFLSFVIYYIKKLNDEQYKNMDERNFSISQKGTYGTSGWMSQKELMKILNVRTVKDTDGTILGIDVKTGKLISLPLESRLNKHTAIFGASGTGKSRCFGRNQIIQCAKRGESVIVTDPKGELYADTAEYLRERGYDVKVFNLVDPSFSDSWNCLDEIRSNPEQIELMAQTFSDVIIKNTGDGTSGKQDFWDTAEMNLLKALSLYVCLDETRDDSQRNIGCVYEMLTNNNEQKLNTMFDRLPLGHPAKAPWVIYKQAGDNVRGNVIIGLGARLQVLQSTIVKSITAHNEIELEAPARKKCAYYVIMSDQDSTLDFLSSLFFSFLFIRLVRYADIKGQKGKCDIPVNFVLDEFPNIGQIPDFTKKLSTIRSRELRVAVIFQNIAQLQNRYPNGLWEEIVGNCDTQLFLGCTDQMTAKFISTRTGEMTIDVSSTALSKTSMSIVQSNPQYKETQSVGKRFVLTPDEVLRWDNDYALIIIRGQKVLKALKYDYSKHPESQYFKLSNVRDYTPKWRASQESKKFGINKETEDNVNEQVANNVYRDSMSLDLDKNYSSETKKEIEREIEREVVAVIQKPKGNKLYSSTSIADDF